MDTKYYYAILGYLIIISLIGIFLTVKDKKAAIAGKRRVPENTLMIVGILGAAIPMFITMNIIHHKTKHVKFMIGLPAEAVLHILIVLAYSFKTMDIGL